MKTDKEIADRLREKYRQANEERVFWESRYWALMGQIRKICKDEEK